MKVLVDARTIEFSWHRGIGRTFKELVFELCHLVDLIILGEQPGYIYEYFNGLPLHWVSEFQLLNSELDFDVYHVMDPMSIYMGFDSPMTLKVNSKIKTSTFYDIIPKKNYAGGFNSWPNELQQAYNLRLEQLKKEFRIFCISKQTKTDLCCLTSRVIELGTKINLLKEENYQGEFSPIIAKVLKDQMPYMLTVGGAEPHKNLMFAKELYLVLKSKAPDLKWIAATHPGKWYDAMKFDSLPGVIALKNVDDFELQQLYKNAQLLLFPSLIEGLGLPPFEASQLDCPVVCSNIDSLPNDFVKLDLKVSIWFDYIIKLFQGKETQNNSVVIKSWKECSNDYVAAWKQILSI